MATKGNVGGLEYGNPWRNLANAIVAQAAHDYELAFSHNTDSIDRDEVARFFCSDWYKLLTSVDS